MLNKDGQWPDASRQWSIDHDDKPPCAWCFGAGTQGNSFGSHGICKEHADAMVAEAKPPWISVGEWERSIGIADDYMPNR